ncbi:hypothetical protein ABZ914_24860 [Spirillospora sp. NPDC046719]
MATNAGVPDLPGGQRLAVGKKLAEKAEAEQLALKAGAAVVYAPGLSAGPINATRRIVPVADLKHPLLPPRITRAPLTSLIA